MFNEMIRRFWYILWYADMQLARLMISLVSTSWGFMIMYHPQGSMPGRQHLTLLTTDQVQLMGLLFFITGIATLLTVLIQRKNRIVNAICAASGAMLWTFSTTMIVATVYTIGIDMIPGIGNHTMIAVSAWLVLIRGEFTNGK